MILHTFSVCIKEFILCNILQEYEYILHLFCFYMRHMIDLQEIFIHKMVAMVLTGVGTCSIMQNGGGMAQF